MTQPGALTGSGGRGLTPMCSRPSSSAAEVTWIHSNENNIGEKSLINGSSLNGHHATSITFAFDIC